MAEDIEREDLYVPDRFEALRSTGSGELRSLIVPVESALTALDTRFQDLHAARRGGLMIMRGEPGAGKSTFLDTVGLFRKGVVTERVTLEDDVTAALRATEVTTNPRIIVIEGREALNDVSEAALEASMHAINTFVRSNAGRNTLVVWPTNTAPLASALASLGGRLGGDALLGVGDPISVFSGPSRERFVDIAERTVGALNEGASLATLGISAERAESLAKTASTIGSFLAIIRGELLKNDKFVRGLLKAEQYRLWVVVISGNDVEGDVGSLTRGGFAYVDIDRLMTATGANIVKELKEQPDRLGILGTVLDGKIMRLDVFTALAVMRQYAGESLRELMKARNMSTSKDPTAQERILASEFGLILSGQSLGTRKRGMKPKSNTLTAFESLAAIATTDDGLLNAAIGEALLQAGLIEAYEVERDLGTDLKFTSDLYVLRDGEPIRIEVMWRANTGRAAIANYVLTKLGNYAKAIGLLS